MWVAAGRWSGLLDLIDQLPQSSRTTEAIHNDPERAAEIASRPEPIEKWTPRLKDWDLTAILLREIREAVISTRDAVFQTTVDDQGRPLKPPRTPVLPTPITEVDRQRAALSERLQLEIVTLFAPHALDSVQ